MQPSVQIILEDSAIDIDRPIGAALARKSGLVHSITPEQSVHRAITRMSEAEVGCLIVTDAQDRLVGIVSERDYCRKVILMGRNSHGTRVCDIMVPAVTVTADVTLREAMDLMTEKRLRHLPVVENDTVIGVLSIGDVVKWIVGEQRETIRDLRHQLESASEPTLH